MGVSADRRRMKWEIRHIEDSARQFLVRADIAVDLIGEAGMSDSLRTPLASPVMDVHGPGRPSCAMVVVGKNDSNSHGESWKGRAADRRVRLLQHSRNLSKRQLANHALPNSGDVVLAAHGLDCHQIDVARTLRSGIMNHAFESNNPHLFCRCWSWWRRRARRGARSSCCWRTRRRRQRRRTAPPPPPPSTTLRPWCGSS